jgi:zinc transport system substrate-binding protein
MRRIAAAICATLALGACSASPGEGTIVAAIYPLAFAAENLARPGAEVIDLTPPGTEAHDLELSLEDRAAIEDADFVLYLGDIGFQPQVEQAVKEARGTVLDLGPLLAKRGGVIDPHIWLEPSHFNTVTGTISEEFCPFEDPCDTEESAQRDAFDARLSELGISYGRGLQDCRFGKAIVTHEAFGYIADFYFDQFGLSGLTPEAEPTAERLAQAQELIETGEAGAIFYEENEDSKETAQSFAADAGVPALPLSTLESEPAEGDYFSVMEDNLASLREGLQCR